MHVLHVAVMRYSATNGRSDAETFVWPRTLTTSSCCFCSKLKKDLHRVQEASSGNRDIYQEVDLIDVALGSARKQCDDAKERANRLSVTVDRLRDAISRFMSKVGRRHHSSRSLSLFHMKRNIIRVSDSPPFMPPAAHKTPRLSLQSTPMCATIDSGFTPAFE